MKKYSIVLYSPSGELDSQFVTDSPKTALNKWFKYSLKYPTMAAIMCGSVEDCKLLFKNFIDRSAELYQAYWVSQRFYYRYDYLLTGCTGYLSGRNRIYFSGNSQFYDQVPLFCFG